MIYIESDFSVSVVDFSPQYWLQNETWASAVLEPAAQDSQAAYLNTDLLLADFCLCGTTYLFLKRVKTGFLPVKFVGLHFVTIKCHQPAAASVPAWQRAAWSSSAPRGPRGHGRRTSLLSSLLSFTPSPSCFCKQGVLTPPPPHHPTHPPLVSLRSSSGRCWLFIVSVVQWEAQSSVGKAASRQKTLQSPALLAAYNKRSRDSRFQHGSITSLNNMTADGWGCGVCVCGGGPTLRRCSTYEGLANTGRQSSLNSFCRPSLLTVS